MTKDVTGQARQIAASAHRGVETKEKAVIEPHLGQTEPRSKSSEEVGPNSAVTGKNTAHSGSILVLGIMKAIAPP
jgi:hypothetical protein